ncbi:MAG: bifunctional chorismate mutase/prephenate dehydratase [Ruminococcaceae bacterium]|nr:bifunctional chorismate mutase/prephenate dehydratase [Oscillospiraceae bacterium]
MKDTPKGTPDLSVLRREIDRIDTELVALFSTRMQVSASVAEYKRSVGMAVTDPVREAALLDRVAAMSPVETADYTRTLYQDIMALSRAYQHVKLGSDSALSESVRAAVKATAPAFPTSATVACQGTAGAYSHKAAKTLFSDPIIRYYEKFSDVFDAIERGECRYGVLPIENSTAGSVTEIYDLMSRHRFYIVRAMRLGVEHCLLAPKGKRLEDITEIVSHKQAIAQCADFLASHPGVRVTPMENTAVAARHAATVGGTVAAIADRSCAELYGLEVLAQGICNCANNQTRFICISKNLEIYPGAEKTSVTLTVPHKPGSLSRMLTRFDAMHVNLTKLESRPIPERDFEFRFYFDMLCEAGDETLLHLLAELSGESEEFRYLGTYEELL